MLPKILLVIILLNSVVFCMRTGDEFSEVSNEIVRAPSGTQLPSAEGSNSGWGFTSRAFNSAAAFLTQVIGMNRQTAQNAQIASQTALETTEMSRNAAITVRDAAGAISTVTSQLHESGALLNALEQRNQEVGALKARLLLAEAEKLEAEARLQRLLSQPTPASATETANAERDSRIRILEESMRGLSANVNQIAAERSELETRLLTFKNSLAEIIDPTETDINILLTKTAAKLEGLSCQQKESAQLYSDAIRELQKQIEGKEELKRGFDEKIERLNIDIQALRTATRRFEGNGYTALFDIVDRVTPRSSASEIEAAERAIKGIVVHSRINAPHGNLLDLMSMPGQEAWTSRLLKSCKYTANLRDPDNATRPLSLSHLFLQEGHTFAKSGSPIDFKNTSLDQNLRKGSFI